MIDDELPLEDASQKPPCDAEDTAGPPTQQTQHLGGMPARCSGLNGGQWFRHIARAPLASRWDEVFRRFDPPVVFAALDRRLMAVDPSGIDFQKNAAA